MTAPHERLAGSLVHDLIVHRIFCSPLKDETASSRIRQLAMMTLALDHQLSGRQITLTNLAGASGLSRVAVEKIVGCLITRGLLTASWTKNSQGRGKAWQYTIAPTISVDMHALIEQMGVTRT